MIMNHKRYVTAADELKAALVNCVHEVKMVAPELSEQVEKMMFNVLKQDVEIFNLLRQLDKKPSVGAEGESGR
ncbi:hypothetical protein [Brevibacillus fulvus]|uniref:Uncharacterized protein n=1 Tax=Brevibacillus fulvus TaxID=1125967 RepID=A0A938Y3H1_9BACL|nr:hypothetical protein [Brevibacillus fulvus]MBM7590922.1 hypothetical protein [Brevibacillus fulvus]